MKTTRIALTALALLAILGSSAPCAQVWQEQRITGDDALPQGQPMIWGDTVWWTDVRTSGSGYYEVMSWSPGSGEQAVMQVPRYTTLNSVYEQTLVYEKYTSDWTTDLYVWDPTNGERAISVAPGYQHAADVWGDTVVWQDKSTGIYQIHIWDPVNGDRALSPTTKNQTNPRIYGDTVVWQDGRNGRSDIYMWNPRDGERKLSTYIYQMCKPAIYEDRVLMWVPYNPDFDFGEAGMWEWTPSGGLRLLYGLNLTYVPASFDVWDDLVIVSGSASSNVYSWNAADGLTQINQAAQNNAGVPSIYENKVVWVGNHDIYLSTLVVPEPSSLLAMVTGMGALLLKWKKRR